MSKYLNKVIIITGSSSGVGSMLALYFLNLGATVIGLSRREVKLDYKRYIHFVCDITDDIAVKKNFKLIKDSYKKIDILINNAAELTVFSALLIPPGTARNMVNTNYLGHFFVMQQCALIMKKNNYGRIISITSMAEILSPVGDAIYSSSKAALTSLTYSLAKEFAPHNITLNSLAITFIDTQMSRKINQHEITSVIDGLPLPRKTEIEDITNIIDFFINDRSDSITGQYIALGGLRK
jgi:3-oxoacyl-[acyl-carrier protein] reductase